MTLSLHAVIKMKQLAITLSQQNIYAAHHYHNGYLEGRSTYSTF